MDTRFKDHFMIVTYSDRFTSETNLNTGDTKVFKDGRLMTEWFDQTIPEFEERQKEVIEAARVLKEFQTS